MSFRMKFEDGGSAIIRFPKPGVTMFLEEKIRNEVAIIRYIQQHTTIPVPFILHWGTEEENRLGLGPFIIMEYIDHTMDLSDVLNTPGFAIEDRPILDLNINNAKLELLYWQFADVVLQLSTLQLPRIGSLAQIDDFTWESGDFWVTYAARKTFAFDAVFWKRLEGRFFGPGMSTEDDRWKEWINLLAEDERTNMDKLVEKKLDETKTRALAWEPDEVDSKAFNY